jgi:acetyl esterase/lipase
MKRRSDRRLDRTTVHSRLIVEALSSDGGDMTKSPEIHVERDVTYASESRPLLWDIYRSETTGPGAPAVLLLHGGGWRGGNRSMMTEAGKAFARHGYVAIAPEYRLLGEVAWPVPLDDVKLAVRTAGAGGEALGIDPGKIFLAGYSAGAHLALFGGSAAEAGGDAPVAGVAAFFPPVHMEAMHAGLLGVDVEGVSAWSPIGLAGRLPPTFVLCGDGDEISPPSGSTDLYQAIRAAGGVADLRLYSHLIHEFVSLPGMMDATVSDIAAFFERTALQREAFDKALDDLRAWWAERFAQARAAQ